MTKKSPSITKVAPESIDGINGVIRGRIYRTFRPHLIKRLTPSSIEIDGINTTEFKPQDLLDTPNARLDTQPGINVDEFRKRQTSLSDSSANQPHSMLQAMNESYKGGGHIISKTIGNENHPLNHESLFWNKEYKETPSLELVSTIINGYNWLEQIPNEIQKELSFPLKLSNYFHLRGHSIRLALDSIAVGTEYNRLNPEPNKQLNLRALTLGALFHDLGKLRTDIMEIAKLDRRINEAEFEIIKQHPITGYHAFMQLMGLLKGSQLENFINSEEKEIILNIIRNHHVWIDQSSKRSYPIENVTTTVYSRIISVIDPIDAMLSRNTGKKAEVSMADRPDFMYDELERGRGTQFDSGVVDIFQSLPIKTTFFNKKVAKQIIKHEPQRNH